MLGLESGVFLLLATFRILWTNFCLVVALQTGAFDFCPFCAFFALNSSVEAVYSTSLPNSAAWGRRRRSGTTAVGANERRRLIVSVTNQPPALLQPRRSPRLAHDCDASLALTSTFRPPPPFPRKKKATFFRAGRRTARRTATRSRVGQSSILFRARTMVLSRAYASFTEPERPQGTPPWFPRCVL